MSENQVQNLQTSMPIQDNERIDEMATPVAPAKDSTAIYFIAAFASIPGLIFGFDTGSIAPVTLMPAFTKQFSPDKPLPEIVRGLIVSSILITASIFGVVAGPVSDRFSRKYTLSMGGFLFAIGSVMEAAANGLPLLFIGRLIAGAGEGLFLSTSATYVLEISPMALRGRLGTIIQVLINVGIPLGFFICYGLQRRLEHSNLSWRLVFVCQIIFSSVLAIGCLFIPFSPRWLRSQGRIDEARQVLDRLHKREAEVEKEEILKAVEDDKKIRFQELFTKFNRPRTILACYISASQQLSGIDAILYYAPIVFVNAGLNAATSSLVASGVTGIVLLVTTVFVAPFMDRLGRRTLLIYGGLAIAFTLVIQGILYASHATEKAAGARWTVIAMIEIFVIAFAATWSVGVRLYITEIQSSRTRAAATSFATAVNQAVNFIIALTTPLFLAASSSGPYFLFGFSSLIAVVVYLLYIPESHGVSLENIDKAFQENTNLKRWKHRLQTFLSLITHHHQNHRDSESENGEEGGQMELAVVESDELLDLQADKNMAETTATATVTKITSSPNISTIQPAVLKGEV